MKSILAVLALVVAVSVAEACGPGVKKVTTKTVVTTTTQTFPVPMPPNTLTYTPKVVYSPLATAAAFDYKPLAPLRRTMLFFGTIGGCAGGNCQR